MPGITTNQLKSPIENNRDRVLANPDYYRTRQQITEHQCGVFKEYISFATGNRPPSKKEFLMNMEEKEIDPDFAGDMEALLRQEIEYNQGTAFEWLKNELIENLDAKQR